jgi:hypothetical protein
VRVDASQPAGVIARSGEAGADHAGRRRGTIGEREWSDRVLADVVGLVALNQLTGSFNLVAGLEPATEQARPGAA